MKYIIALEGADGSGKSTISSIINEICAGHSINCSVIGREKSNSSQPVGEITDFLKSQMMGMEYNKTPVETNILLRLAREYLRVDIVNSIDNGFVILDRFVISVLSRIRYCNINSQAYTQLINDLTRRSELHSTIFCKCSMDVSWQRVLDSNEELSPKEKKGKEYNKSLKDHMWKDFSQGTFTGEKWVVNTELSFKETRAQIQYFLLPIVEKLSTKPDQ